MAVLPRMISASCKGPAPERVTDMNATVAVTAYLNNRAYFQHAMPAGCELVAMYPRQAIAAVSSGQVQAAMVPVAGLAELQGQVDLLGNFGISAAGPVKSVYLFSHLPFEQLGPQHLVQLTSQSATSVNLLALLLRYQLGSQALPTVLPGSSPDHLSHARLLIGDDALEAARHADYPFVTDLAGRWVKHHRLPFVFARWVIRRDAPVELRDRLTQWQQSFVARETEYQMRVAEQEARRYNMTPREVFFYLRGMKTALGSAELAGQQRFLTDLATYQPEFTYAMPDLKVAYA